MNRQHLPFNMLAAAISALLHVAAAAAILAGTGGSPQSTAPAAMPVTLVFAPAEPASPRRGPIGEPPPLPEPREPIADLPAMTDAIISAPPSLPRAAEAPAPMPRHKPAPVLAAVEPSLAKAEAEPLRAPADTGASAAPAAALAPTAAVPGALAASLDRFVAAALGTDNPRPNYPPLARRRGLEGRVLLRTEVLANGQSGQVSVLQSSGSALLDHAAEEAVRHWHFVPARAGDRSVPAELDVPVLFRLTD